MTITDLLKTANVTIVSEGIGRPWFWLQWNAKLEVWEVYYRLHRQRKLHTVIITPDEEVAASAFAKAIGLKTPDKPD